MPTSKSQDKKDEPIQEGDYAFHQGRVCMVDWSSPGFQLYINSYAQLHYICTIHGIFRNYATNKRRCYREVQKIVTDEEEAEQEDVKNPPKVIYSDQHGHQAAHNPGTPEKTQPEE